MNDHAPQYIDGDWYVPVQDLTEALDALERLFNHVSGVYKRSGVHDHAHALTEAENLLKASHRR
jgi:hypothetical protein